MLNQRVDGVEDDAWFTVDDWEHCLWKTMPHSSSKFIQLAKHLHKPRRIQRSPVVQHLQGQSPQKA